MSNVDLIGKLERDAERAPNDEHVVTTSYQIGFVGAGAFRDMVFNACSEFNVGVTHTSEGRSHHAFRLWGRPGDLVSVLERMDEAEYGWGS